MNKCYLFITLVLGILFHSQERVVQSESPPPPAQVVSVVESHQLDDDQFYKVDSLLQEKVSSSNTVYPKLMSPSFQTKYTGDEFDYTLIKPQKSFWERLKSKLGHLFESIFGSMNYKMNSSLLILFLKILGIIVAAFLLFFVLRFFFDKNRRSIFGKKNVKFDIDAEELHENIHEINFPEAILDFESKKDYRSAVRYQFLYVLKKLNAKHLIVWNPEKTNRDYELEIKTQSIREKYSIWSSIFEYVWYGEFDINEREYHKLKDEFETANF